MDWAENGSEAVDQFEASDPGSYFAIFMDMQMPVIKGTELFSMIEMMSPETIRIVMTDGARIADTVAFMNECRTFKIIIKPCRVADDLMAPIRAAFRYKEQLERAAGQEQEQETAYSMTEQAYLEHRRMWLMLSLIHI